MTLHRDIHLETEICVDLAIAGWRLAQRDAAVRDRTLALFPADLLAWVQMTQPR